MMRQLLILAALAILAAMSVHVLREATMTRHTEMPPDSVLVVEGSAEVRGRPSQDVATLSQALVLTCVIEAVPGASAREFSESDGRFSFEMAPAADEYDRRQLRGCLEDLRVDGLVASVTSMEVLGVDLESP